jgi:hypothetical protein
MYNHYCIAARIVRREPGWESTHYFPYFYLHENVQGIVNEEHAVNIARKILDPFNQYREDMVIEATKI